MADVFTRFRSRLILVLAVSLTFGIVLAALGDSLPGARAAMRRRVPRNHQGASMRLKELSARLVEAQEKERRTISRELHDEVGQSLTAVLMEIGNLNAVIAGRAVRNCAATWIPSSSWPRTASGSVRNMALLLRPSMLDDLGLVPALQWQAREVSQAQRHLRSRWMPDSVSDDLPEEHKTCIYRVVQEALHNCVQHAGSAQREDRGGAGRRTAMLLAIEDDGRASTRSVSAGMGLLGMEERVTHLGGAFADRIEAGRKARLLASSCRSPAGAETSA